MPTVLPTVGRRGPRPRIVVGAPRRTVGTSTPFSVEGVPREQKMLKGHLPRVLYHQVYLYTQIIPVGFAMSHGAYTFGPLISRLKSKITHRRVVLVTQAAPKRGPPSRKRGVDLAHELKIVVVWCHGQHQSLLDVQQDLRRIGRQI